MSSDYVVCVNNEGYPVSLELLKIYRTLPNEGEPKLGLVRVIDESGEDYLYPGSWFLPIELSEELEQVVSATA